MNDSGVFLRWAGSKKKLVPLLSGYYTKEHKRYFEPFMGSAVLYYDIQPDKAIISDSNVDLVSTYNAIKYHPRAVFNRLRKIALGKDSYYEVRALNPNDLDEFDSAARFIFLNRFCFNGLYRTNKKGEFNVPYSSSRTGKLPDFKQMRNSSEKLKGAKIICSDFEKLLLKYSKKGDFVYLDPPYATNNKRIFRQYGPQEFGIEDIARLVNVLDVLNERGVDFVLSYAWCSEAKEAFGKWGLRKIDVRRNISGFAKSRRIDHEMIVTNI